MNRGMGYLLVAVGCIAAAVVSYVRLSAAEAGGQVRLWRLDIIYAHFGKWGIVAFFCIAAVACVYAARHAIRGR